MTEQSVTVKFHVWESCIADPRAKNIVDEGDKIVSIRWVGRISMGAVFADRHLVVVKPTRRVWRIWKEVGISYGHDDGILLCRFNKLTFANSFRGGLGQCIAVKNIPRWLVNEFCACHGLYEDADAIQL